MIEIVAPWSLLRAREQRIRVLVQGVDIVLQTCAWDGAAAADCVNADVEKQRLLEADFAERRQKLLSSDTERAHWLSLLVTALLSKADVSVHKVKVRLDDLASSTGEACAGSSPGDSFGLDLDKIELLADPGT